jgi:hypothetical protein
MPFASVPLAVVRAELLHLLVQHGTSSNFLGYVHLRMNPVGHKHQKNKTEHNQTETFRVQTEKVESIEKDESA